MPQDPVPASESPFSFQTRRRFLSLLGGAAAAGTLSGSSQRQKAR